MNNSRSFTTIFVSGMVIPILIFWFFAYPGIDVLSSVFKFIPSASGGTINSNYLRETVLLNSASIYLGALSGLISALLCARVITVKNHHSKDVIYTVIAPAFMIVVFIILAAYKSPTDLAHANVAFRAMAASYISSCIYYSAAIVIFFVLSFVPSLMFISVPLKLFSGK